MFKGRHIIVALLAIMLFAAACQKNTASKIPYISLAAFYPQDSMRVNVDSCIIKFNITDGDGDIGNDSSLIYLKDSRYDSVGFFSTPFPPIDQSVEDPNKGIQGVCIFIPIPQPVPRPDSLHTALGRDTFYYELYITDRAGHVSNHIITPQMIITP